MAEVFGEVAGDYDDARPGYPPGLAEAILAYHGRVPPRLVEIGAGTAWPGCSARRRADRGGRSGRQGIGALVGQRCRRGPILATRPRTGRADYPAGGPGARAAVGLGCRPWQVC
ncbi:hypothetical protein KBX37_29965 [Micromonospora sp. U56]|uniref:hypothetical protein n=1 Tax=Micromonospora sp. U56 TaxID=2824900 RepID=UPI001B35A8B2|nr:hypothetical protein [Micromonospora sp. U56]MBQ0897248.1 hypothetical protein [Micromonospora sp. U56]